MRRMRRRRGAKRPARRAGRGRSTRPVGKRVVEFASAKQVLNLMDDSVNTLYTVDDVNLSQFDRLSAIARCYQYYRITKIEMKFKPYWDTYVSTGGPGSTGTVPYFHYLVDTGEVLIPVAGPPGFNEIRDAGAKPIRFDEKTINVVWRPRVPQIVAGNSSPTPGLAYQAMTKFSPWLTTNNAANEDPVGWAPSTVPHKGLYYGVEQAIPNPNIQYGVEITVFAQFKKPLAFSPFTVSGARATKKLLIEKTVAVSE